MATEQKRAKAGGEYGPNGEWYPGGAFIATTDMPKKVKEKINRAASGREQVEVGFGKDKYDDIKPGEIPIVARLYGKGIGPNGYVNETFLDKQGFSEEAKAQYREASKRFNAGERFLKVTEFPLLANYSDAARLINAGLPVPGDLLSKMPEDVRATLIQASNVKTTNRTNNNDSQNNGESGTNTQGDTGNAQASNDGRESGATGDGPTTGTTTRSGSRQSSGSPKATSQSDGDVGSPTGAGGVGVVQEVTQPSPQPPTQES
jgi:hypothetical protein